MAEYIKDNQGKQPKKILANNEDKTDKDNLNNKLAQAIITEKPNVKWDDVAGLTKAKEALKEAVIMPMRFP